jgi:DNA-binding PadR family transcriptional regulator
MALRHAILAALLDGDASGYELSKRFDVSVANFWTAVPQQLYRELEQMKGKGLVDAHVVEQERRPNKRVYALTDAGREELAEYTATATTRPTAIRDELLVKLVALESGDADAIARAVAQRLEQARGKLAFYERLRDRALDGRAESEYLRDADRVGPYLTLMRGLAYERENVAWCRSVLDVVTRRAAARSRA